jgi:hypothetical protein
VLAAFYDEAISQASAVGRVRERELRPAIDTFITPGGTRHGLCGTIEIPGASINELERRPSHSG